MSSSIESSTINEWTRSDAYNNSFTIGSDEVLDYVRKNSLDQGLEDIAVSAAEGKFLHLLARTISAKRVLEIGTLGGYSAIWFARALPDDGEVVALELEAKHVEVATQNIAHAGLSSKVKIIHGNAIDSLRAIDSSDPKFDLVFIDADKQSSLEYFTEAKRLTHKGSIIVVDNVVRHGNVANLEDKSASSEGVRRLFNSLPNDKEVDTSAISTVGDKGYDGFLYALRL